MKKFTITVEPTIYFTQDGIGGGVFFNETDDGVEFDMSWDELIEKEFEMQTIPHQESDVLTLDAVKDVHELICSFENAAKKMRERLTSCLVLDRQAWLDANDGKFNQENRDEFMKYFSYDMVED